MYLCMYMCTHMFYISLSGLHSDAIFAFLQKIRLISTEFQAFSEVLVNIKLSKKVSVLPVRAISLDPVVPHQHPPFPADPGCPRLRRCPAVDHGHHQPESGGVAGQNILWA